MPKLNWSAIAGGLATALAWAIPIVDDGLKLSEVLGIVLAFLTGMGIVYGTPDKPVKPPTE